MSEPWILVEPCAGSAALTLHRLGAKRTLFPYQGSKWPIRKEYSTLLDVLGFEGRPSHVLLTDLTPIADAIVYTLRYPQVVARELRTIVEMSTASIAYPRAPEQYFSMIHNCCPHWNNATAVAEFLWLQRMAFSGKAVGLRNGRFLSPGLNRTSAYGVAATERFGEVKPMGPALIRAVEALDGLSAGVIVSGKTGTMRALEIEIPTIVFLDPPYQGATGYPNGTMSRAEVVKYARQWAECGAAVVVCEAEPIVELQQLGWKTEAVQAFGERRSRMHERARKRGAEWVTYIGASR